MKLSIIVPAYNEEQNLSHDCLVPIAKYAQKYTSEIILVNDGSTDNTLNYLKKFSQGKKYIHLIDNPHMGKAASIMTGVRHSTGDIILFTDMDQATPISEFDKFVGRFNSGYDIVIGSRSRRQGAPMYRQILAYGMVIIRTLILNLPFSDTQCGFKAFTKNSALKIFPILERIHPPKTTGIANTNPGFDVEMLYIARKLGFKIAQVPVSWHYVESKRVSFIKDAFVGLRELLLVRLRSLTNKYF